ncbi:Glucose 1-dehydrogenase 2 [Slackia heliotrinireducens]|uniref:3beta-hydroxycholanate 3-dehydrogenase (NAD(+)) n=1 Tax=Slackia heliotrinireducens (strain ATCC 29202 / DSM 20476 / NCTC 11029 / RHS 1) TaxID=471855 RepID=C7N280_SLAHD|nr:glucose 1-dehydrogenase [Slackia heliotrinireducens]ACV21386.1 dehydrogenase of unknown specificity, short-chain alcohol dehydrogenase like protein [Slackia heliotrinireducens DSM 20476]VEG98820.1 Glucose 1-dehydrogenase 2 [Slackia heliotrinireducens]
MGKFENKTVVVTGASSGIGKAIAEAFGAEGANVAVNYRANKDGADAVVANIEAAGGKAIAVEANIIDPESVQAMTDKIVEAFGTIDVLVNSAGAFDNFTPIEELSVEEWDWIMDVDVKGIFLCCKYMVPVMLKNENGGNVINIASGAGLRAGGGSVAYTAAKHAVVGFTAALSDLYSNEGKGIRANAICPGLIETRMVSGLLGDEATAESFRHGPAGRWGQPCEIANAALYLASDESSFIHGISLPVDGGWLIRH